MKVTSAEYQQSMKQPIRDASFVEISYRNVNEDASKDGTWEVTPKGSYWSSLDALDTPHSYKTTIQTCEPNRCLLNGNWALMRKGQESIQDGYVSESIDTDVEFTRSFSRPQSFPGVTLHFDTRCNENPDTVQLKYYTAQNTLLSSRVFTINSPIQFLNFPAENIKGISIILKASTDNLARRSRLESIIFGEERVFTNKDLKDVHVVQDIDPLSRRVPKHELTFTVFDYDGQYDIDNPTGSWVQLDEHALASIRFGYRLPSGATEWLKADQFMLSGRPTFKAGLATFKATSALAGTATDKYYKDSLGGKFLFDLAVSVLQDMHLPAPINSNVSWIIDDSLKRISTFGLLPIAKHIDCLQMIAHAACCTLYMDDNNVVHIEPFNMSNLPNATLSVDSSSILRNTQRTSKIEKLKRIDVRKNSYYIPKDTKVEIVFSEKISFAKGETKKTLHFEFDKTYAGGSAVYAGVYNAKIYAQAADITVEPCDDTTLTIGMWTLARASSLYSLNVATDGAVDTIDNPLISDDNSAARVAQHTADYLQLRTTYDQDYRGNPELQSGDTVTIQTKYSADMQSLVLINDISFNGSLHGKLKTKCLSVATMQEK